MRKSMAHHQPCSHSDASTTVGVRHYITIANTEKGDGYQPHCIEQICMFFVMVSVFPGKGRTVIERGEGRRGAERVEQEELPGCQVERRKWIRAKRRRRRRREEQNEFHLLHFPHLFPTTVDPL